MESGIYQIINPSNGKIYIGSSKRIKNRWRKHLEKLNIDNHSSIHLQRAWNKREYEFIFIILEICNEEHLIEREQFYLDYCHPEYNISPTAGCSRGIKRRDETKEKLRQINLGKKQSKETIEKRIQSIKESRKPLTEEQRRKFSISKMGKNNPIFKSGWEKQVKAMAEFNKGKKRNEETKLKISKAHSKTILQLSLDDKIIKEWPSATHVERELGYSNSLINRVCNGKLNKCVLKNGTTIYYPYKKAYGFKWMFKKDYYENK